MKDTAAPLIEPGTDENYQLVTSLHRAKDDTIAAYITGMIAHHGERTTAPARICEGSTSQHDAIRGLIDRTT